MRFTIDRVHGVVIIRVDEPKLLYPMLSDFSESVSSIIADGESRVVIDMSNVTYVDSATIGCFMDFYRQATNAGGGLRLANVQKRVESVLTITRTQQFIEIHPDEHAAVASFGE